MNQVEQRGRGEAGVVSLVALAVGASLVFAGCAARDGDRASDGGGARADAGRAVDGDAGGAIDGGGTIDGSSGNGGSADGLHCWDAGPCWSGPVFMALRELEGNRIATIETRDFDGDGNVDIALAGGLDDTLVPLVLLGDGELGFDDPVRLAAQARPTSGLAAGTFASECTEPCIAWAGWNDEAKEHVTIEVTEIGADRSPSQLFAIDTKDVAGACRHGECAGPAAARLGADDGLDDLLWLDEESLFYATSRNSYAVTSVSRPVPAGVNAGIAAGEASGDGRPDFVTHDAITQTLHLHTSDANGDIAETRIAVDQIAEAQPFAGDTMVARSCRMDCSEFTAFERVDASGSVGDVTNLSGIWIEPESMAVGNLDLDPDGADDVVVVGRFQLDQGWFNLVAVRGDGAGGLTDDVLLIDSHVTVHAVAIAQLDGEAGPEIIVGSNGALLIFRSEP